MLLVLTDDLGHLIFGRKLVELHLFLSNFELSLRTWSRIAGSSLNIVWPPFSKTMITASSRG